MSDPNVRPTRSDLLDMCGFLTYLAANPDPKLTDNSIDGLRRAARVCRYLYSIDSDV